MNDIEKITKIASENNGIIKTKEVVDYGIRKEKLKKLCESGFLVKIKRGMYTLTSQDVDEYYEFQQKYPTGIFSYGTALYFLGLSNRVPNIVSYTVIQGSNVSKRKSDENVKYHYVQREVFEIGKITIKSPQGAEITIYDRERTICDIIKNHKKMDIQIYNDALNGYFRGGNKNIRKLIKYGRIFGVEEKIMRYMEVLQ